LLLLSGVRPRPTGGIVCRLVVDFGGGGIGEQRVLDALGETTGDRGGVLEDLEAGLLGPGGQVGDAVDARVETNRLTTGPGDGFDDELLLGAAELRSFPVLKWGLPDAGDGSR
jgi:hypothetical protein